MKLSEIKGERTFTVIADCIGPVVNIAKDPEAARMFKREKVPEGMDKNKFVMEKIQNSIPVILKAHKEDLIAILATLEGVSKKAYKESLTISKLISDCIELVTDEVFMGLFISAQRKTGSNSSGSVQENTQEPKVQ